MELKELLNKYRYPFQIHKTEVYKNLDKHKEILKEEGFSFSIKTMKEVFDGEIVLQGIMSKLKMDACYTAFVGNNYDTFDYINYDEKRKMFNHDMEVLCVDFPSFIDPKSGITIYIPFFESFINQRYKEDYQILTLKKHEEYLREYPRELSNISKLYGIHPYVSTFSSLQVVGKDDEYVYFYFTESKSVHVFDKEGNIVDEINVVDKFNTFDPTIEQIQELLKYMLVNNDQDNLEYMHQHAFISDKAYKKINKKLG